MTDQQTQIDWQARAEAAERQVREARGLLEAATVFLDKGEFYHQCLEAGNRGTNFDCDGCDAALAAKNINAYLTTPAPSPAQATDVEVERLQEALKKIASAKHGDTSCSLPAQGYGELECAVIEAEDYLARIALAALAPPADAQGETESEVR